MNFEFILDEMQHDKPRALICTDEAFSYFELPINGFYLMYRQKSLRPDGRRCFFLTDELAMALGFYNLYSMQFCLSSIQYWRRFVSVQRLKVALQRYHNNYI